MFQLSVYTLVASTSYSNAIAYCVCCSKLGLKYLSMTCVWPFNNGWNEIIMSSIVSPCVIQWRHACFFHSRYERVGYLEIDGTEVIEGTSPAPLQQLNTNAKIYLGMPIALSILDSLLSEVIYRTHFVGDWDSIILSHAHVSGVGSPAITTWSNTRWPPVWPISGQVCSK